MAKSGKNSKVDAYLAGTQQWREELRKLRMIMLDCGVNEELKWGKPCYTFQNSNIAILQGFKKHCALLFCKGALLKDVSGILAKPGENTQAARRVEFTNLREIIEMEPILRDYIREAVEVEKAGLEVSYKKPGEFKIPEEFKTKLREMPEMKAVFSALTPGRQRAYLLYFSAAKQSKTRESRIQKCLPQIFKGKGLND